MTKKMNYRKLGATGLDVSEIGMGCEGFAKEDCRMAQKLFDCAEEYGVNYFDLYASNPEVREAVGRAWKGRREKFIVQGHLCSTWENGQYLRTRDLKKVKAEYEKQLTQLQTDYIDVGMLHYCDAISDWETIIGNGILDYARELKKKGVIRHIGLSSHNPKVALRAVEEGAIEVLMFSVNPCYDLQPGDEDIEKLWADESYEHQLTNMDPERQRLYELCLEKGVGITVMKAFGGGDLLDASLSPAGVELTVSQCIEYCLTRPAVDVVLSGAHNVEELLQSIAYEDASQEERDYAAALSSFPKISWEGHCMYCNHCLPCPKQIDIASVTKFLNLAIAQKEVPETVCDHYRLLAYHGSDCIACGACEKRCPFHVGVIDNMKRAVEVFGY